MTNNTNQKPIIEFKDVTFQYKVQSKPTLKNIDLTIYEGEKVLILGQSGSGKSTIAHLINGLIPHYYEGEVKGQISVCGLDPVSSRLSEIARKVGTVLQDSDGQFIGLTVAEDIAFSLENNCCGNQEILDKVNQAAEMVSITSKLDCAPQDLSGGQKQRVTMAGVLVEDVDVLLFDEPLASLDPASGRHTIQIIDDLHRQYNKTVLIIEHRLEDVLFKQVDRVILVANGTIIANGTPDQIIASGLLIQNGIREPLYIGAMRLANKELSGSDELVLQPQDNPAYVNQVQVPQQFVQVFKQWANQKPVEHKHDKPLLQVQDLKFDIDGNEILKGISFQINQGEMLAICGSNGAGKSTLAKLICGFEKLSAGKIFLSGNDITDVPIARRSKNIGFVIQNPNQMISKTMLKDEVGLALENTDLSQEEKDQLINRALKVCGISKFRNWPLNALSYGQKKRVTIASILVSKPEIVILDEPTAGQDWAHYTEIMDFLRELNDAGTTIILITHDMHLALEYTDRALVVSDGQIIADDTPANILTNEAITKRADLVTTSLYDFAKRYDITPANVFIDNFIEREKVWRESILGKN